MAGKWLIVLLVVLLPVFGVAQTSPRLDSISLNALDRLGISQSGAGRVTLAKVYGIVNEGIEDVSTHWPAVEKTDTVVVYDSTEGGRLNSDFSRIRSVQWMIGDSVRVPIEYMNEDSLVLKFGSVDKARADIALVVDGTERFYYYTFGSRLYVLPKYDADTSAVDSLIFLVSYYAVDDKLTTTTDSTTISSQFRRYLRWYVYGEIETLRGRYDRAAFWTEKYENARPPRERLAEGKK